MEYSKLGNSDLEVSKICLGTMTFGEQNSEAEAHEQMDYAIDQGINFFDTAELYAIPSKKENNGLTELYIGSWLKKTGRRNDVILSSKISGYRKGLEYIRPNLNFSSEQINQAVEGSLERMGTDCIDLYQLHWPERKTNDFFQRGYTYDADDPWEDNFLDILQAMDGLIKKGKIRYWGLSNETPWGLMHFCLLADQNNLPRPLTVQNPYSLLNRGYEVGLAEMSIRENIPLLAYSPLAFGMLSGKYHKKEDLPRDRINKYEELSRYSSDNSYSATGKYIAIAENYQLSPAQMALAFVNTRPFVGSTIIGATTMAQLIENVYSINVDLEKPTLREIEAVHELIPTPAP